MLRTFRLIDSGRAAALSAVVWLVAACAESSAPTTPKNQFRTELITCQASVSAGTLDCAASQPEATQQAARGMSFDLVLGGQGALVRLASSGTAYNSGTQTFSSNVTLENLISQVMNSADGTTPDAGGIKVFFNGDPTVTGGTGTVSVANRDGTGTFLGAAEPYFLYSSGAILASGAMTSAKSWHFSVPTTVSTFTFQVFVSTRLPDETSAIVALGLSRTPSAVTILPGASGTTTVTLTRTNFTGAVTLSVSGAPGGVTSSFSPSAPTGTSSTLTLNVGSAVTPGDYPLTVTGTGTGIGGTRSTRLTLTVGTAGSGNVTVDFSSCPVAERAVWVAAQNGTGPWTRISGVGDVYNFTIGSSGGGVAYVTLGTGDVSTVALQYMTQTEFTVGTLVFCPPTSGKTINGSVANAGASDITTVSLGGRSASVFSFGSSTFQLTDVPDGAQDLVAYDHSLVGGAESAIIRRGQNIADNGTIPALDFSALEAFTPTSAIITLNGLIGGETVTQSMFYQVAANCATATLYGGATASASFTALGIPSAQQVGTDFHGLSVFASTSSASRIITQYNHALVARTLTLGAVMPTPSITLLVAPYERLEADYTLPGDYQGSTAFGYNDGVNKSVSIVATFGYLGGAAAALALPDFSALPAWDNNWAPSTSSTGKWTVSGVSTAASPCTENGSFKSAAVSGPY